MLDLFLLKALICGVSAFFIFLSHVFVFRRFVIARRFFVMVQFFGLCLIGYTLLFICFPLSLLIRLAVASVALQAPLAFMLGLLLLVLLCYSYVYVLQVIDRSPSTRIMAEIEQSRDKKLTLETLSARYSIKEKVLGELDDMVHLGYLNKKNGRYYLTPRGRFYVRIFQGVRNYLRLRRS